MAISYVGGKGAGSAGQGGGSISLTSGLTGGSGGSPLANDLVVVTVSVGTAARQPTIAISTPSGYTALTAQRTTATSFDTNVQTCYKVMGSTPDTTVTIPASGNSQDGISYAIQVFRGVSTSNPMDVTAVSALGTGTALVNPAAITPSTSGAWIVVCGGGAATTGANYTAGYLTNLVTNFGSDTNDSLIGCGYYTGWTSGSYDPAVFGGGSNTANDSWGCTTIALRPAPEAQALTQSSRFDESNAFYAATVSHGLVQSTSFNTNTPEFYAAAVTTGGVTVTQSSRFDSATNEFYSATVSAGSLQELLPSLFANDSGFYAPTLIPGSVTLTQSSSVSNSNSSYAPVVNHGLIQATRFDNSAAFYAETVSHGLAQSARFDNSGSFYAATVNYGLVQVSRADNSSAFYAATVNHGLVQSSTAANSSTFHTSTVSHGLTQASRFDNSAAFYSATVTAPGATQSLQANLFANVNAFFSGLVSFGLTQASRFDNTVTFYSPEIQAAGLNGLNYPVHCRTRNRR